MTETLNNVNRVVYDMAFVEDAFNLLPYEQRNKENLVKMLLVFAKRWDNVQNAAINLAYGRFLDNAVGEMLDGIASRMFIERGGQSDQSLRGAIKLRALRQDNEGTRDQIVNILQIISGSNSVNIFKGENGYVEVVFPQECLSLKDIKVDIEGLFPVNTNLVVGNVTTGVAPFGTKSISNPNDPNNKKGTLSSRNASPIDYHNSVATKVISTERLTG